MKEYLVLIREPDGRTIKHSEEETLKHQLKWKDWLTNYQTQNRLVGGKPLTLTGAVLRRDANHVYVGTDPYKINGDEIVGGYLIIRATSLSEAVEIMKTCPVFEFDGFIEVREIM